MKVCLVTCFYGRAEKVERILRFFIDQTYQGPLHLLLYNNSPYEHILGDFVLPENKTVMLVNNFNDIETGKEYTNTGDIFRDALTFVPPDTDVVSFFDSDDCFLPTHTSEGVKGMEKAMSLERPCLAYKPFYSFFLSANGVELAHNTLEPSIFVKFNYIQAVGFNKTSASYHQKWELDLKYKHLIFIDPNGEPTLIYNWEKGHNTYKISGSGDDGEDNLKKHREYETDFGDGYLDPASPYVAEKYYKIAYEAKHN